MFIRKRIILCAFLSIVTTVLMFIRASQNNLTPLTFTPLEKLTYVSAIFILSMFLFAFVINPVLFFINQKFKVSKTDR